MIDGVFDGVRVLEVAEWTLVPAAGAVLAEFGADVIKVERPIGGDIQRGLVVSGVSPSVNGVSLQMEQTNRGGKRSVGIDITSKEGQALVHELVKTADVFLTSLLPQTRTRLGMDAETIRAINPSIVYASGHGLGSEGPDADKGGYDMTAYWCRGGFAYTLTEDDFPSPVRMRPAIGDKLGAMNIVTGVAGGLLRKEKTGKGTELEVSLLGTAMWQLSSDIVYSAALGIENSKESRGRNPLVGYYRTADERWFSLALLESDRWWPRLTAAVGLEHLLTDPRFDHSSTREQNYEDAVEVLGAHFRSRPLSHWREALADFGGPWAPVQSVLELSQDPQVLANGYLTEIKAGNGESVRVVPAPIRFDGRLGRLDPCPEAGAHTEEVLLELGHDWDEIGALKDAGTIT